MKRMIDTGTWDDPWFAALKPDAKLVFLYLLTNRRSTAAGAFEITLRAMAFETGINQPRIETILEDLGSRVTWWPGHQMVWVHNFFKHQSANENFHKSAQTAVADMPVEVQCAIGVLYPTLVPQGVECGYATGSDTHTNGYATGSDTPDAVIDIDIDREKSSSSGSDGADASNALTAAPEQKPKRATQVPEDFAVTDALVKWAASQERPFTVAEMESQRDRFVDHYSGNGKKMIDWHRTFQNWMRNALDYGHLEKSSRQGAYPEPVGYSRDPEEAEREMVRQLEELQRKALNGKEGQIIRMRREA